MQRDDFIQYVQTEYGCDPEYLWSKSPDACIFRHASNKKWFCIVMTVKASALKTNLFTTDQNALVHIANVKAHPLFIGRLREKQGILPAYHMNKEHWVSLVLNNHLTNDTIKDLVEESYQLTRSATK
ncbi:MmcQ/YjbR family DNA-binding protein [Brucellaceae bacterium C25G]